MILGAGLLGLSGAVFCLGLIAGHELAVEDQHSREVAAIYPLPAQVAAQPASAPTAGTSLETLASHSLASASPTPGAREIAAIAKPPGLMAPLASPTPAAKRVAATTPPSSKLPSTAGSTTASSSAASVHKTTHPERKLASREAPSSAGVRPHSHQPYSVQIDAVMDRQGAENVVRKLTASGYEPYIVPTEINGQTWYKVRVGHYDTEDEARAAEQRLRTEYEGSLPTH